MKTKSPKMINSKENKIARGYRLKPETHMMIVKIQNILGSDQDEVIASACTMFYNDLKNKDPEREAK